MPIAVRRTTTTPTKPRQMKPITKLRLTTRSRLIRVGANRRTMNRTRAAAVENTNAANLSTKGRRLAATRREPSSFPPWSRLLLPQLLQQERVVQRDLLQIVI